MRRQIDTVCQLSVQGTIVVKWDRELFSNDVPWKIGQSTKVREFSDKYELGMDGSILIRDGQDRET